MGRLGKPMDLLAWSCISRVTPARGRPGIRTSSTADGCCEPNCRRRATASNHRPSWFQRLRNGGPIPIRWGTLRPDHRNRGSHRDSCPSAFAARVAAMIER